MFREMRRKKQALSQSDCAAAIQRDWKPLCMLELSVEYMSGKEAIELVQAKQPPAN